MSGVWRRGPGGVWLVFGRTVEFKIALDSDGLVEVRRRAGGSDVVSIEHYTEPNHEGYGYAWPTGTAKATKEVRQLATVMPTYVPIEVCSKSYRRRRAIRRRARGPARGP